MRNTIFELDPYHITAGATFSASSKFTDSAISRDADSDDRVAVLPGLRPTGSLVPCDGGHPWGANCTSMRGPQPHTTLILDLMLVENYAPSPDSHADHDHGALREGLPWEPVVNCDGSYTMEEHIDRHKPPTVLLTNLWVSAIVANTISQLVFANSRPAPMDGMPLAIGEGGSQWGSKESWMLFDQLEIFSAEVRVILPSLYAPFGLPQPSVAITNVTMLQPAQKGMPSGHHLVAKAWRQPDLVGRNSSDPGKYCGHLAVASGLEQTPARFTLQLSGSLPPASSGPLWATRLFSADYKVAIVGGKFSDWIDAAGHNVYQLGC